LRFTVSTLLVGLLATVATAKPIKRNFSDLGFMIPKFDFV
jgi:hypothetical protein